MNRADCRKCNNRKNRRYEDAQDYSGHCEFGMRFASTAGGSEPDDMHDVYFCSDSLEDSEDSAVE